ncbi:hypothetical protein L1987_60870 [Smallanthus sonchifolius]|uniref:Uncharacterized protein n=1 Tax=Smallanthus sonchifolius TaxID=185202 RepID=A0ACB9D9L5_9ASTR|nr:hypothetical protein L1987_60870 [Smallanthus sonchifolius]
MEPWRSRDQAEDGGGKPPVASSINHGGSEDDEAFRPHGGYDDGCFSRLRHRSSFSGSHVRRNHRLRPHRRRIPISIYFRFHVLVSGQNSSIHGAC